MLSFDHFLYFVLTRSDLGIDMFYIVLQNMNSPPPPQKKDNNNRFSLLSFFSAFDEFQLIFLNWTQPPVKTVKMSDKTINLDKDFHFIQTQNFD